MEVFLLPKHFPGRCRNFLHVCGGVSDYIAIAGVKLKFSPRMWRCFWTGRLLTPTKKIFSTYVEVFLNVLHVLIKIPHFLHVCGGVSRMIRDRTNKNIFSPRMWRCFLRLKTERRTLIIFSTYVEVFLTYVMWNPIRVDFLHVCGGVSTQKQ